MTSFCNRTTQCHFSGSTMKHGRYSWMHHKLHLQNSPGPSQTKKPWSSSCVAPHVLGAYSRQYTPFVFWGGGFLLQLPAGLRHLCLCSWFICSEGRVRQRLVKFHQTRQSKREEREQQHAAGRQTHMEDFFRITRKRSRVSNSLFY